MCCSFYTLLPPRLPEFPTPRSFIILPPAQSPLRAYFQPAPNARAADEVDAHMNMFDPRTNDSYYALGLETAKIIREAIDASRIGTVEGTGGGPGATAGDVHIPFAPSEGPMVDI